MDDLDKQLIKDLTLPTIGLLLCIIGFFLIVGWWAIPLTIGVSIAAKIAWEINCWYGRK